MAFKGNKLKQILLDVLKELHQASGDAAADQWFSRKDIARKLRVKSEKLNPARVGMLQQLVADKKILVRQKPDDGRDLPQYQLV